MKESIEGTASEDNELSASDDRKDYIFSGSGEKADFDVIVGNGLLEDLTPDRFPGMQSLDEKSIAIFRLETALNRLRLLKEAKHETNEGDHVAHANIAIEQVKNEIGKNLKIVAGE